MEQFVESKQQSLMETIIVPENLARLEQCLPVMKRYQSTSKISAQKPASITTKKTSSISKTNLSINKSNKKITPSYEPIERKILPQKIAK